MMTLGELHRKIREAGATRVMPAIYTEMGRIVAEAEGLAKSSLSGSVLRPRTGNLRRAIVTRVEPPQGAIVVGAIRAGGGAKDVRYASLHEQDGVTGTTRTVRPKKPDGFLAIPMGPALTASGVAKFASPRQVPDLRFIPIRGGSQAMLVKRTGRGKNASWVPWFHLVRSVTIPARPYLQPAMREASRDLNARMGTVIHRALGLL